MEEQYETLLSHWKERAERLPRASLDTELWSALRTHLYESPDGRQDWIAATEQRFLAMFETYREAEKTSSTALDRVAISLLLDGIEHWLDALESLSQGAPTRSVKRAAEQGQRNLIAVRNLAAERPSLALQLLSW